MKTVGVNVHIATAFLILELGKGEWLASRCDRFSPKKRALMTHCVENDMLYIRSGHAGQKRKNQCVFLYNI
jgi:hypothetical protein